LYFNLVRTKYSCFICAIRWFKSYRVTFFSNSFYGDFIIINKSHNYFPILGIISTLNYGDIAINNTGLYH